jgi:carbamoylphosphate synthase large subunit
MSVLHILICYHYCYCFCATQEAITGVVVSVGGQIPQNLALPLEAAGKPILGTAPSMIDRAEDRHKFSAMVDEIGLEQVVFSL